MHSLLVQAEPVIHEQNEYRFQLSMGKKIIPLRNFLPREKGKVGEREIAKKITNNSIPILNMHQDLKFQNLNSCPFIPSCNLERHRMRFHLGSILGFLFTCCAKNISVVVLSVCANKPQKIHI